jgi:hypothetical protein
MPSGPLWAEDDIEEYSEALLRPEEVRDFGVGLYPIGQHGHSSRMQSAALPSGLLGSLKSKSGTEFFDAETEGPNPPFSLAKTDAETSPNSKSPLFAGQMHGSPVEFDTWRLDGGGCQGSNLGPPSD